MLVFGLSCSARRNGNTAKAITLALSHLKERDIEVEHIRLIDYDLKPCRNCAMECYFEKDCPTPDDSSLLMKKLEECDGLIVGSPVYNGTIPALLATFLERNPHPYDEVLVGKVTGAIIVGSIGETFAALNIMSWLAPNKHFIGWIDLDPRATAARRSDLKNSWLEGNMMDDEFNRKRVINFADKLYEKLTKILSIK